MKLHEEKWTLTNCGNPAHGETWECWKVVAEDGRVVLRGVAKKTAERHAALPVMARALMAVVAWDHQQRVNPDAGARNPLPEVIAALTNAGVLP